MDQACVIRLGCQARWVGKHCCKSMSLQLPWGSWEHHWEASTDHLLSCNKPGTEAANLELTLPWSQDLYRWWTQEGQQGMLSCNRQSRSRWSGHALLSSTLQNTMEAGQWCAQAFIGPVIQNRNSVPLSWYILIPRGICCRLKFGLLGVTVLSLQLYSIT